MPRPATSPATTRSPGSDRLQNAEAAFQRSGVPPGGPPRPPVAAVDPGRGAITNPGEWQRNLVQAGNATAPPKPGLGAAEGAQVDPAPLPRTPLEAFRLQFSQQGANGPLPGAGNTQQAAHNAAAQQVWNQPGDPAGAPRGGGGPLGGGNPLEQLRTLPPEQQSALMRLFGQGSLSSLFSTGGWGG
jgi:hypothetical protein